MKLRRSYGVLLLIVSVSMVVVSAENLGLKGTTSSSSGWLEGWQYRKAHNITGSTTGDQMNYPILLLVHYNSGFDSGGEVFLNGKCRSDFGDVRFTDSTGINILNYWIQQQVEGVQALFWVKVNYIPQNPGDTTVYIYYGNASASTTSNKDWTFNLMSDFEDGTKQEWIFSRMTSVAYNGVSNNSYQGNYSRRAEVIYGRDVIGSGDFYDIYQNTLYLSPGSYIMECHACISDQNRWLGALGIEIIANGVVLQFIDSPGTLWHWLSRNFTVDVAGNVELDVRYHISVSWEAQIISQDFYLDSVFVRKWCYPEPTHGSWGIEQSTADSMPPLVSLIAWLPTSPYPLVQSSVPRQWEPVLVMASVSDEVGGTGINYVELCSRVNGDQWNHAPMTFNATSGWWNTIMPGQPGNSTVEFYVCASDNAGNTSATGIDSYVVKTLVLGDINGDGVVNMWDIGVTAKNFGQTSP